MSAAKAIAKYAQLSIGDGAQLTTCGLRLDGGLEFEQWQQVGEWLGRLAGASAWYIGDWINYGFWEYGKTYEVARDATGLAYQTLMNYASVCEAFDFSLRREKLSFTHHAHVAALDEAEREQWLDRAEANGWSSTQLFEEIRAARELPAQSHDLTVERIRFTVPTERAQRWQQAAEREGLELAEWAARRLDEAAAA